MLVPLFDRPPSERLPRPTASQRDIGLEESLVQLTELAPAPSAHHSSGTATASPFDLHVVPWLRDLVSHGAESRLPSMLLVRHERIRASTWLNLVGVSKFPQRSGCYYNGFHEPLRNFSSFERFSNGGLDRWQARLFDNAEPLIGSGYRWRQCRSRALAVLDSGFRFKQLPRHASGTVSLTAHLTFHRVV